MKSEATREVVRYWLEKSVTFDKLFENRQRGDYLELYEFEQDQVVTLLEGAEGFVAEIHRLLETV